MSKKGLTTSVLGSHLGFDVPAVVRRGNAPLHSVAPETPEAPESPEPGRAAEAVEARAAAPEGAGVAAPAADRSREPAAAEPPDPRPSVEPQRSDDDEPIRALDAETHRAPQATSSRRKQPVKVESRSSVYRVGTQRAPYERADGTKTEKAGFTAPHGFKEELNLFCLTHRLGTTSEWIVATLRREMERTRRKG